MREAAELSNFVDDSLEEVVSSISVQVVHPGATVEFTARQTTYHEDLAMQSATCAGSRKPLVSKRQQLC